MWPPASRIISSVARVGKNVVKNVVNNVDKNIVKNVEQLML